MNSGVQPLYKFERSALHRYMILRIDYNTMLNQNFGYFVFVIPGGQEERALPILNDEV
jgi:hypothetical protein